MKNTKNRKTIRPTSRYELMEIIEIEMDRNGIRCDLNFIDVSLIQDMSRLFENSKFNGDISKWDVSHVKNMHCMFSYGQFNGDISKWDVSQVEDMSSMFYQSAFNQSILGWKIPNIKNMSSMFSYSKYKQDLSHLDIPKDTIITDLCLGAPFEQPFISLRQDEVLNNIKKQREQWLEKQSTIGIKKNACI